MPKNDFHANHLFFDEAGFNKEFKYCIDIALDKLSGYMHDVWCTVISQCTEAAFQMYLEAQRNVKELSREITDKYVSLEVGIDENNIDGGEREYIKVMVSLHGNGEVWTKPGGQTWKKYVAWRGPTLAQVSYHIEQFDQKDHSDVMVKSFEYDMQKYIKMFLGDLYVLLDTIDYDKYVIVR